MPLLSYKKNILNGKYDKSQKLKSIYKIPEYVLENYSAEQIESMLIEIPKNPWIFYNKSTGFSLQLCQKIADLLHFDNVVYKCAAYIVHALDKVCESGHCFAYDYQVLHMLDDFERKVIEEAFKYNEEINKIFRKGKSIYLSEILYTQASFSKLLKTLNQYNSQKNQFNCYKELSDTYSILNNKQREAVEAIENNRLIILTGLPGTGKTTTIKAIVESYGHHDIHLFAPTGKAASRITELCASKQAFTLHSTFGLGAFYDNAIIIIDEMSMCDILIAGAVGNGIGENCVLILVGDNDQLPSVGPGQVLLDVLESGIGVRYHLDEVMRQKPGSILLSAHAIHNNKPLVINEDKEIVIYSPKNWDIVKIAKEVGNHPEWKDAQFLSVLKDRGSKLINPILREIINPGVDSKFRIGDKVIQTKNNKELDVSNGEVGYVVGVSRDCITVDFGANKLVGYTKADTFYLDYAYCMTVHKSQGSEFEKIVFVLNKSRITNKNLLYTGLTRAKKRALIICEHKDDILEAIDNTLTPRQSHLAAILKRRN